MPISIDTPIIHGKLSYTTTNGEVITYDVDDFEPVAIEPVQEEMKDQVIATIPREQSFSFTADCDSSSFLSRFYEEMLKEQAVVACRCLLLSIWSHKRYIRYKKRLKERIRRCELKGIEQIGICPRYFIWLKKECEIRAELNRTGT